MRNLYSTQSMCSVTQVLKTRFIAALQILILSTGVLMVSDQAKAQCVNTSLYPSASVAAPTPTTTPVSPSSCNYQTEYNSISGVAACTTYQSSYSLGGWITVRIGTYNGTQIAAGNSPLTWKSTTAGTYFIHYNTNNICGTNTACGTSTLAFLYNTGYGIAAEGATTPSTAASTTSCAAGSYGVGSGAYRTININANTYYDFSVGGFPTNINQVQVVPTNGSGSNGTVTLGASGSYAHWYSGTTTTVQYQANRSDNCTWVATSAILTYKNTTPVLGSPSNAGPIDYCSSTGDFGTPVSVTGYAYGTPVFDWGSSNGAWNPGWTTTTSGTCCFPKKVNTSDGNADRIRYNINNNGCVTGPSATILLRDRYNEAPSSLTTSANNYCTGSVGTITLTANFPANIAILGTVKFYSGSCGGTLVGTVTAGNNVNSVATTITAPTVTTNYYVLYDPGTAAGGCAPTTCASTTVTVLPTPVASISGTTTVCQNSSSPSVTFTNSAALPVTVSYTMNGTPATINVAGSSTNTVVQSTTSSGTFTYSLVSVAYQSAPTCPNALSGSAVITVRPTPTASISGTATVCQNGTSPNVTFTNGTVLPVTVSYNVNGTAATVNIAASSTANVAHPTATAGTFTYNLVSVAYQAAPSCSNIITGSAVITVNPTPTATISGTATVCLGDASPNVTFTNGTALPVTVSYTVNGTGATVNIAASSTAAVAQSTAAAGSFTYSLTSVAYQAAPTCSNTISGSAVITVNPTPTATISGTATACSGVTQQITFTNGTALPVTVTYNINGGSSSTVNIAASSTSNVAQPGTTPGVYVYNLVSVAYQSAPGCSNSISGSATVTDYPVASATISGTTTVCQGGSAQSVTFTNGTAYPITVSYNINGGATSTLNVAASSTATVSQSAATAGTFAYNLTGVKFQGAPPCAVNAPFGTATITVNPTPTATISGTATVCQNGTSPNVTFTNGTALPVTVTYNVNGGTNTTVSIAASSTSNVAQTTTSAGVFTYNLVSVEYQSAPTCTNTISGSATITVNPTPTATISGTTTLCQNATAPDVTFTNGMALPVTVTYNVNGGTNATVNVAASSTATVSQPTTSAGVFTYNLVSVAYQSAPACASAISGTAVITVNPATTISVQPSTTPQNTCIGGTFPTLSVTAAGTGTLTYQWYVNTTSSNIGGSPILFATGSTYTPSSAVPGTLYYYVVVTGSCSTLSSNVSGGQTVNIGLTISTQPSTTPQSTCQGGSFTALSVTAVGTSPVTYQWYSNTTASNSGGTLIGGATSNTYTPSAATVGVLYYYVVINSGCGNTTSNLSGAFTVNPNATLVLSSGSANPASFCQNTALPVNIVYTFGGGATSAGATGLPSGITGSVSGSTFTISGTPTVSGTFPFTVTTTGTCAQTSLTGTITVAPVQAITLTSGSTSPASFCQNTALPTPIVFTISGGATGANQVGIPSGMTGILSGNTFTISGTPTVSGSFPYTVTTSGTCGSTSTGGTITVDPIQAITLTSGIASQSVCNGVALTSNIVYTLSGGATNASTTGLPSGVSGSLSGSTYTISGTPTVTGTFPFTVTTTGTCAPASTTGTIVVNPNQIITLTSGAGSNTPAAFCQNSALPTNITYTLSGGATGATATGLPAGITGTLSGTTFTISGTPTVSGTYNYTVNTSGTCSGSTATGTITVDPIQAITLTSGSASPSAFCVNTALPANIVYTLGGGAASATVAGLPTGIGYTVVGNTVTISGTPSVSGSFPFTVTTSGTCAVAYAGGTITVTPDQSITLTSGSATPAAFCQNTALPANIVYTLVSVSTVTPTGLPAGITGVKSGNTYTISGTPTVSGTFPFTLTTTGACNSTYTTGTITVSPGQVITLTSGSTSPASFCQYTALPVNIVFTLSGGATGASTTGLPAGITGSLSGSTYTISGTPTVSGSFPYTVTTSGTCGAANTGGTISIYAAPVPTITPPATFCTGPTTSTYTTQSGQSSYTWTQPGSTAGVDYNIVAGGTSTDDYITIQWLSTGGHTVTVNYANANGCFGLTPASDTHTTNAAPAYAQLSNTIDPCNGGYTATVNIAGGTSPYNFTVCGTAYTAQTSPFSTNPGSNSSCTLTLVTDANGCEPSTISGTPVTYTARTLTAGDVATCMVGASATQVFYDHSGQLIAKITDGGSTLGTTTVTATVDPTVTQYGPTSPQSYGQRHYRIQPTNTSGSAGVCLYMTSTEASNLSTASASDNHGAPAFYKTFSPTLVNAAITKFSGGSETPTNNTSRMVIPRSSITVQNNPTVDGISYGTGVYELCFTVTSWSGFYIHAQNDLNTPLPVTLLYLTADAIDNKYIHLEWATASEINNKGFEMERSTDGIDFKSIGFTDGNGNTNSKIVYGQDDKTVQPGTTYYYRLKQIDIDGQYVYSEIVSASLTGDKTFTFVDLMPNPAFNSVQLGILAGNGQKASVSFTDMLGRAVLSDQWQLAEGYNINTYDLSGLAAGTYNVTVYSGNIYVTKRLVVTK